MKNSKRNKSFKRECKVINLEYEYDNYDGDVKYAIITNLSEETLNKKYKRKIERYKPFIIINRSMGCAFAMYERYEKKHQMRQARSELLIPMEPEDEYLFIDVPEEDNEAHIKSEKEKLRRQSLIRQALSTLTPTQRERLINYHIKGMTLEQIAQKDGIAIKNAFSAIKRAERNLINAYERLEAAS